MQHNNPLPTEILNLLPTLTPLQLAWLSGYAWSQASGVEQQVAGQHLAANLTALSAEPFQLQCFQAHKPAMPNRWRIKLLQSLLKPVLP